MLSHPARNRGFTLFEILIALAILSIAMGAIISLASNQTLNAAHLRDKTFAHWLAVNKITELQVTDEWPNEGKKEGNEEMGLHEWHWVRTITDTPDDRVRQVEFSIFRGKSDKNPVTTLTSFLSQPI